MSEAKAAFAERTKGSVKSILCRCMEHHGYKYIGHNPEFQKKFLNKIDPKKCRESILYSKPLRDYRKPKFRIGDKVCIFKHGLPFTKCCRRQFT